jgi:glutamate racemase
MSTDPEPSNHPLAGAPRIGVFDSGLGGLSVLRALREVLPGALLHYVADSAHAPYGERDDAFVIERSLRIAAHLIDHGAQLIVVACNTATALAVAALRDRWPALPIVGIEPGLKPALAATRNGRIGVMATRKTLASPRFAALLARQPSANRFHLQACDGLAAAIETGRIDGPEVIGLVERHGAPLHEAGVDTVVLGCTHYAFVEPAIRDVLGQGVVVIDTAQAVARRTAALAGPLMDAAVASGATVTTRLETTADAAHLRTVATAWLHCAVEVSLAEGLLAGRGRL